MKTKIRQGDDELERIARDVAHIIGPSSGAARALAELERLRKAGYKAALHHVHDRTGGTWLVEKIDSPTTESREGAHQ